MDPIPALITPSFPVVVSGPSGVGKTVLCRRLTEALPWTCLSVSATTRPPRAGEREGESYYFYTPERFLVAREERELAEWAEVHGHLYGTPRAGLDRKLREGFSVVLNIDVQGGLLIREVYPDALLVFVLPPSFACLRERLVLRGTDGAEEIVRRMRTAELEIGMLPRYDHVIVNDDLEQAATELIAVVRAERTRTARRLPPGTRSAP